MNRQVLQLLVDHQAEEQTADAEEQPDHQKGSSVQAEKIHARQIRQHQAGFATGSFLCVGECGKQQQAHEGRHGLRWTPQKHPGACLDGTYALTGK
jgi:hypothetical protein